MDLDWKIVFPSILLVEFIQFNKIKRRWTCKYKHKHRYTYARFCEKNYKKNGKKSFQSVLEKRNFEYYIELFWKRTKLLRKESTFFITVKILYYIEGTWTQKWKKLYEMRFDEYGNIDRKEREKFIKKNFSELTIFKNLQLLKLDDLYFPSDPKFLYLTTMSFMIQFN